MHCHIHPPPPPPTIIDYKHFQKQVSSCFVNVQKTLKKSQIIPASGGIPNQLQVCSFVLLQLPVLIIVHDAPSLIISLPGSPGHAVA